MYLAAMYLISVNVPNASKNQVASVEIVVAGVAREVAWVRWSNWRMKYKDVE
jgi:hypothetical protein